MMRFGVCEAAPEMVPSGEDWQQLAARAWEERTDVFLLNEMPFGPWISCAEKAGEEMLLASHRAHEAGMVHLVELGARSVLATRPVYDQGRSVNQAFVWRRGSGIQSVHTKQFFPDEEGYYEARWFARGDTHFRLADVEGVKIGFLICTEVMFNEWARHYGRQGAHVIAVPRAVGRASLRRWKTALSMAAIVSGCYVISSNRAGIDQKGQEFGGGGWIFDPFGDLIAETSPDHSVVSVDLDLALVERAQQKYPCCVSELPSPTTTASLG
ncbi:MAG: carbon-nitrogen hydrolase family protein [Gemmatimonadetes bacterium]|nr:carbon-nitrogen hydrolase family protein [Gemmatimonadota bacterium]